MAGPAHLHARARAEPAERRRAQREAATDERRAARVGPEGWLLPAERVCALALALAEVAISH